MRFVWMLLALLGVGFLYPASAWAHAVVVSSSPTDGARLATPPALVSVTFDETVGLGEGGYLQVTDAKGQRVDQAPAGSQGPLVSVTLRSGLGDGTYLASFRVISADSHPVTGSFRFVVGDGALAAISSTARATDPTTSALYDLLRWAGFVALALLSSLLLLAIAWPAGRALPRSRMVVLTGWCISAVTTLLQVPLQGAYAAGRGLSGMVDGSLLNASLHSTVGTACSIRLLVLAGFAVLIQALFTDTVAGRLRLECAAMLAVLVLTYVYTGHAAAQSVLAVISTAAHLAAMAIWLGGLGLMLATGGVVPRFSLVGYGCVSLLAVTGFYQAWLGVGSWRALSDTYYGRLVLVKVLLFVVMLAAAFYSRRWIGSPLLRRSVLIEAATALVVLAVTAVLVSQPQGRTVQESLPRSVTVGLSTDAQSGRSARLTFVPSPAGNVTVTVHFTGPAPQQVSLAASLGQIGPITVALDSQWRGSVQLPAVGVWVFDLRVQYNQFDAVTNQVSVKLR